MKSTVDATRFACQDRVVPPQAERGHVSTLDRGPPPLLEVPDTISGACACQPARTNDAATPWSRPLTAPQPEDPRPADN